MAAGIYVDSKRLPNSFDISVGAPIMSGIEGLTEAMKTNRDIGFSQ